MAQSSSSLGREYWGYAKIKSLKEGQVASIPLDDATLRSIYRYSPILDSSTGTGRMAPVTVKNEEHGWTPPVSKQSFGTMTTVGKS